LRVGRTLVGKHVFSRHFYSRVQGKLKLCVQQFHMLINSLENSDFANKVNRYKQVRQDIWRRVNDENACQGSVKKKTCHQIFFPECRNSGYKTFFPASCITAERDTFTEINDECLKTVTGKYPDVRRRCVLFRLLHND